MKLKEKLSKVRSNISPPGIAHSGITPHDTSPIEKAEGRWFKSSPRNFDLKFRISYKDPEMSNANASNEYKYRLEFHRITIYLNKIHKLTGYKKIAEKINNLYLLEMICAIMGEEMGDVETPPCELYKNRCPPRFPLDKGMRLKVK